MSKPMPNPHGSESGYECLDPTLGAELWRLADPDCPDELRSRLETHVKFCADCRLKLAVEHGTATGLRDGSLDLTLGANWRSRPAVWTTGLGAAALAAGLALLILMPPRAPHEQLTLRGDDGPTIERPVADEVVLDRQPTVRWTALAGATRYDLRVEAVEGDYRWSVSTDNPEATIPREHSLPAATRFRVRVEPVPAHLAPDGALRSSFRTGSLGAWFGHRLSHGVDAGRALGGVGLAAFMAGLVVLLRSRRSL